MDLSHKMQARLSKIEPSWKPGHIQTAKRQLVSLFIVSLPAGGPRKYEAHYW